MERLQTAYALCSQRRRGGIRSVSAGRARMRKKNSIINMIVGLVGQLLNMLLSFGGRMVFVHYLSQEYLGVNGLFGDVLGMLNLAELGIGSAMIFSMYRPAAQNDGKQLARLMNLYRTLYRIVALAVLGIGLALMPFLPLLMKGGVCTICAYPGHAAGDEERAALMASLSALRPQEYNVLHHRFLNAGAGAPECFVVQRQ